MCLQAKQSMTEEPDLKRRHRPQSGASTAAIERHRGSELRQGDSHIPDPDPAVLVACEQQVTGARHRGRAARRAATVKDPSPPIRAACSDSQRHTGKALCSLSHTSALLSPMQ